MKIYYDKIGLSGVAGVSFSHPVGCDDREPGVWSGIKRWD